MDLDKHPFGEGMAWRGHALREWRVGRGISKHGNREVGLSLKGRGREVRVFIFVLEVGERK